MRLPPHQALPSRCPEQLHLPARELQGVRESYTERSICLLHCYLPCRVGHRNSMKILHPWQCLKATPTGWGQLETWDPLSVALATKTSPDKFLVKTLSLRLRSHLLHVHKQARLCLESLDRRIKNPTTQRIQPSCSHLGSRWRRRQNLFWQNASKRP